MTGFHIVLFDDFETLDAFGPAEIIGRVPEHYQLDYYSPKGGMVTSSHNIRVQTRPFRSMSADGVLLIPGGMGTRTLVDDAGFIGAIAEAACHASHVLTVCTGVALLAKTGLLDGRQATTNKRAFAWVRSVNEYVDWQEKARWVVDGCFYTASGVTAGMDMALGFLSDRHGQPVAQEVAEVIEYIWNTDKTTDPFSLAR